MDYLKTPMVRSMGGDCERQNRPAQNILNSLLRTHGESLNENSLRTRLAEVEGILNSRPIKCESIGDVNSYLPLSQMQLLTMNPKAMMPPPGIFQKEDLYCCKPWRRVQHLCDEFWTRWRKKVYATLQVRQKCNQVKRNFQVGEIVVVRDNTIQNAWPMARILKTFSDK